MLVKINSVSLQGRAGQPTKLYAYAQRPDGTNMRHILTLEPRQANRWSRVLMSLTDKGKARIVDIVSDYGDGFHSIQWDINR